MATSPAGPVSILLMDGEIQRSANIRQLYAQLDSPYSVKQQYKSYTI